MNLNICDFTSENVAPATDGICTLSPLHAALTMRFGKKQRDTSKVLRLPREMTMEVSKVLRLPHKTTFNIQHVVKHVGLSRDCHEVPRLPRETRLRDF